MVNNRVHLTANPLRSLAAGALGRSRGRSARRTCLGGDESGPIKPDRYNENGAPENERPELRSSPCTLGAARLENTGFELRTHLPINPFRTVGRLCRAQPAHYVLRILFYEEFRII